MKDEMIKRMKGEMKKVQRNEMKRMILGNEILGMVEGVVIMMDFMGERKDIEEEMEKKELWRKI